jgi:hypothetical protein
MVWPGHSNFKLSPKRKNNFRWLPTPRMPRLVARLANLGYTLDDVIVENQFLNSIFDVPC